MQSVLSPIVGRLSDVLDRKYLAAIPPLIAFVGAIISAKATSMSMLIGGGILIGTTLATISIVQAIPSEILPLKYRALANGFSFMGGAIGGLFVPFLKPPFPPKPLTISQGRWSRRRSSHQRRHGWMAIHILDSGRFPWSHLSRTAVVLLAA
jgi:MFS family permease